MAQAIGAEERTRLAVCLLDTALGILDKGWLVVCLPDTVLGILDKACAPWPRGVGDRNSLPIM